MKKIFKVEYTNTRNDKSELALHNKCNYELNFLYQARDVGYEYNEKGYYHKRENGVCHLILYVKSGSAKLVYDNSLINLNEGTFLFISLSEKSEISAIDSHWEIYFMNIMGSDIDKIYHTVTQNKRYALDFFNPEKFINNVCTLCKLYKEEVPNYFKISEIIYSTLLDVVEQSQKNNANALINKAVLFMNKNYNQRLTVDEICKELFVSKYFFIRKFHKETGLSPKQYVNKLRLDKAKYLLVKTNDSIIKIAQDVGFENEKNIYYAFKKDLGISPKEYRENFL